MVSSVVSSAAAAQACPVPFAPIAESIPPNVFAVMDGKVAKAVAQGADVIDLAKGNPDAYPAQFIRDEAKRAVDDPLNARYTSFDGKPAFLEAAATWYQREHGVSLDWPTQLFAVEGAVDALAGLYAILIEPGDAVAFADPYYPSYHCMAHMCRAEEVLLPALAERGFLPDLDAVPDATWDRVKLLVLNYPNNPTGAAMNKNQLKLWVDWAREHGSVILFDAAYEAFITDGDIPHSIFELDGAKECAIEFRSFSKTAGFTGVRCAYTVSSVPCILPRRSMRPCANWCALGTPTGRFCSACFRKKRCIRSPFCRAANS